MVTSADIVRTLRGCEGVTRYLKPDRNNNIPIYQIVASDEQIYPHFAVFETAREYETLSDDAPIAELAKFRINLYSKENNLHEISRAVRDCLRNAGFYDITICGDGWSIPLGLYTKSVRCSAWSEL